MITPFTIFPLGDSAITIDLGNTIDEDLNRQALSIANWLKTNPLPGILDIVPAYSSVSVFYDPHLLAAPAGPFRESVFTGMRNQLEEAYAACLTEAPATAASEPVRIPVCYEDGFCPDLATIANAKGLSPASLVEMHVSIPYKVYMIGFLPGFPYLGKVDPVLATPRKEKPVPVPAGAVGIAGNQTGVYPVDSPGGWQIIGRTPLTLFDRYSDNPVRLQAGDWVRFYPVDTATFHKLSSVAPNMSFKTISDRCHP